MELERTPLLLSSTKCRGLNFLFARTKRLSYCCRFIESESGFKVQKAIREYIPVGHDDNINLDRGWIEYAVDAKQEAQNPK